MVADISKTLGKDFLVSSIVPAGVLVGTNMFYVRWKLLPYDWFRDWTVVPSKAIAIATAIFAVALGLSMLRTFIYRSFEGYERRTLALGGVAVWLIGFAGFSSLPATELQWAAEFCRWTGGVSALIGTLQHITIGYHRYRHGEMFKAGLGALERYRAIRQYPESRAQVLPTAFGNVLRAFEEHPRRLYGIDPISTWPRLVAVVPDAYLSQISDTKTIVTLSLNLCVVSLLLAFETALLAPRTAPEKWFVAALAWAVLAAFAYRGAISMANVWGEYFRSAFDLYRLEVLKRMSLDLPAGPITSQHELTIWQQVQLITFFGEPSPDLKFVLKEGTTQKKPPTPLVTQLANWLSGRADSEGEPPKGAPLP